jgi:hypothetical protein
VVNRCKFSYPASGLVCIIKLLSFMNLTKILSDCDPDPKLSMPLAKLGRQVDSLSFGMSCMWFHWYPPSVSKTG